MLERRCCSKRLVVADVLLCHDDELEGRRIAFILYLVPPWEKSDGGTLDLYSADGKRRAQPRRLKQGTAHAPLVGALALGSTGGVKGFSLVRRSWYTGGTRTVETGCGCQSWQTTLTRGRRETEAVERGNLSLPFLPRAGAGQEQC